MIGYLKTWLELETDRRAVTALEYGVIAGTASSAEAVVDRRVRDVRGGTALRATPLRRIRIFPLTIRPSPLRWAHG
jgi:hypothetical protein